MNRSRITKVLFCIILPALLSLPVFAKSAADSNLGTITITAKDEVGREIYARVIIDGKKVGTAPRIFELTAGSHLIKLVAGNLKWSGNLEVVSDQTTQLEAVLKRINPNLTILNCSEIMVDFPVPFSWSCEAEKCEDIFVQVLGVIKDKYRTEHIDYRKMEECSLFGVADAFREHGLEAGRIENGVGLYFPSDDNKGARMTVDLSNLDRNRMIMRHHRVKSFLKKRNPEVFSENKFIFASLVGVLAALDAHSTFYPPELFERLAVDIGGKFSGLGMEVKKVGDVIRVIKPLAHSPAERAGILADDLIVEINGEPCKEFSLNDAQKKLRGKSGTVVALTIERGDNGNRKVIDVKRGKIQIPTVQSKWLDRDIAYLKISQFNSFTGEDTKKAVDKILKERNPSGWILDLRNNPGGIVSQAGRVVDIFLDDGKITYLSSRESLEERTLYAGNRETLVADSPLVCIVNEASASAAEIVAAAFKDHNRAILLGENTFGKWTIQTVIRLQDGSGLKLTTGKYFSPQGNSFHAKGILPHIAVKRSDDSDQEIDMQLDQAIAVIRNWQTNAQTYLKN